MHSVLGSYPARPLVTGASNRAAGQGRRSGSRVTPVSGGGGAGRSVTLTRRAALHGADLRAGSAMTAASRRFRALADVPSSRSRVSHR